MGSDPRRFVVERLAQLGSRCPDPYARLLDATPPNRTIDGLDPWAFLPTPERDAGYCAEALGAPVLPFAQAVEQDLIACFSTAPSDDPAVVVIDPWAEDPSRVVVARLAGFAAWLVYAAEVSRRVAEEEAAAAADD